ncbi:hypothetical protein NQ317_007303 [Molorchus minor]|uniref:SET domain-containing protein n=1 Tax=Molorchus minor TaxID=1323400 RepID=A0ABQ9JVP3_9CUCU|nr:hypothetical protein NQ317_007303 [Molorchus minor]
MSTKSRHRKKNKSRSRSQSVISENVVDNIKEEQFQDGPKFEVKVSEIMGRYIVSKKDIRPGEVILSEEPLVIGHCTGCKVQCLGCYKCLEAEKSFVNLDVKNAAGRCAARNVPVSRDASVTRTWECAVLQETKSSSFLDYADLESVRFHLQAIVPLRCLLLKSTDPTTYNAIMDMESHDEIRKHIPEVWNGDQTNVVDRIIKDWGLTEFTEEEVHTICGILEVNCFEIGQQGVNIRGLYPTAFLLAHDCVPNTNHNDEETNYKLTIRASTKIPLGYPITLSYAYTLQLHVRCSDPTELGTYSGALICPKCKTGLVLSDQPLKPESSWSCKDKSGKCPGYSIPARSMKLLLHRITQEVEQIDLNGIEAMEAFLSKYRNVLHPTHYLCLGIKVSLSQLYGKINGYLIYELSNKILERKRDVCMEILRVLDVIEPGYTRIRGVTLYLTACSDDDPPHERHGIRVVLQERIKDETKRNNEVPNRGADYTQLRTPNVPRGYHGKSRQRGPVANQRLGENCWKIPITLK